MQPQSGNGLRLKQGMRMTGRNATYKVGGITLLRNQQSVNPAHDGWLLSDETYAFFHIQPQVALALLVGARKLGTLEKL